MNPTHREAGALDALPERRALASQSRLSPRVAFLLSLVIALILLVADVLLPRGATVAIGYCIVPALMARMCSRRFLFGMVFFCTIATWVALFTEPHGYEAWKSVLDRSMVTGVLWLSFLLVVRRMSAIEDLTQREQALKRASAELERSNADLSRFTSIVAHDLRGPLHTIGLYSQLLSGSDALRADGECLESVDSIQAEVNRMDDFVQSLLAYGRAGSGELRIRDCDCARLLDEVRRHLKADLQQNGAQVSNDPLPLIQADPTLLAQLFQNLIENAVKYRAEAAPHIHISATAYPQGWQFTIRDNGIGVNSQDIEQIFKPFHQAASGQSRGRGMGLGLATCRRIVERHGGQIEAHSILGQGTTFVFTIACSSNPPSPTASPKSSPLPNRADSGEEGEPAMHLPI